MRKKIYISYLGKLSNQKFPAAYASILRTVEGSVISEEYLTECLEVAKAKQDELGFLENMRTKHPLTKVISVMNKNRHDYLLSLKVSANNALKSPFEDEQNAGVLLSIWLEGHQEYLSTPRIYEQSNLVNQLKKEMNQDAKIHDAMTALNLTRVFDSIELITEDISKTHKERTRDRNAKSRFARVLRSNAKTALKRFLNALDLAIIQGSENSAIYIGYWNDIASELDELNAMVESRRTRMRNAAKKNEQEANNGVDGEMGDEAEGDGQPTRTARRTNSSIRSTPYSNGMDMDLQNKGQSAEGLDATDDAMNGSGTINNNDVATPSDGNTAQADDAKTDNGATTEPTATGNGELTDDAPKTSTADGSTTGHSDATDYNSEDE